MGLLQMSLSGAVMALAVIAARAALLNRVPKQTFVVLWVLVALRLLVPVALPFGLSAYTLAAEPLAHIVAAVAPELAADGGAAGTQDEGADAAGSDAAQPAGAPGASQLADAADAGAATQPASASASAALADSPQRAVPSSAFAQLASALGFGPLAQLTGIDQRVWLAVWAAGALGCGGFFALASFRCRRELRCALPVRNEAVDARLARRPLRRHVRVRQSDRIATPLTYGIVRPVVVLPGRVAWDGPQQLAHVLEHELAHIRRLDGLAKLVLLAAACAHWFNPLAWVMCALANRDIELACDERVVRALGTDARADYARTLVRLGELAGRFTPLASGFGTTAIEERIGAIMKTPHRSIIALAASGLLVVGIPAALATSAVQPVTPAAPEVEGATGLGSVIASYTDAEWGMLTRFITEQFDFGVEGYTNTSIGDFRAAALEAFGTPEGSDLLARLAADDDLRAWASGYLSSYELSPSATAAYICYVLLPFASDDYLDYAFSGTLEGDASLGRLDFTVEVALDNDEVIDAVNYCLFVSQTIQHIAHSFSAADAIAAQGTDEAAERIMGSFEGWLSKALADNPLPLVDGMSISISCTCTDAAGESVTAEFQPVYIDPATLGSYGIFASSPV